MEHFERKSKPPILARLTFWLLLRSFLVLPQTRKKVEIVGSFTGCPGKKCPPKYVSKYKGHTVPQKQGNLWNYVSLCRASLHVGLVIILFLRQERVLFWLGGRFPILIFGEELFFIVARRKFSFRVFSVVA